MIFYHRGKVRLNGVIFYHRSRVKFYQRERYRVKVRSYGVIFCHWVKGRSYGVIFHHRGKVRFYRIIIYHRCGVSSCTYLINTLSTQILYPPVVCDRNTRLCSQYARRKEERAAHGQKARVEIPTEMIQKRHKKEKGSLLADLPLQHNGGGKNVS